MVGSWKISGEVKEEMWKRIEIKSPAHLILQCVEPTGLLFKIKKQTIKLWEDQMGTMTYDKMNRWNDFVLRSQV